MFLHSFNIIDYCYFAWPFYNDFKIFLKSLIWWNSRMQLQKDFGRIVHFIKKCLTLIHSLRWYIRSRANVEISASKSKNYHLPFFYLFFIHGTIHKKHKFFYYNSLTLFPLGKDKFITVIAYHVTNPSELLAFERMIISQSSLFGSKKTNKLSCFLWMGPRF